jgi:cytochrome c peroxidase
VPEAAKRGETLFFNRNLGCFRCHAGFNFSDATVTESSADREIPFHNIGLYNLSGAFSYPAPNLGIYEFTKDPADVGKFKTPTLRNIALTAPYMHDGSIATLQGVLEHYAAGGRTITTGQNAGLGRDNPNKDIRVRGFTMSAQDRDDVIAFLKSLTDEEVLRDPRFSNPFQSSRIRARSAE